MGLREIFSRLNCTREYLLFQEKRTISVFLLIEEELPLLISPSSLTPYSEITLDYNPSSSDFFQDILVVAEEEKVRFYSKEKNNLLYSHSFSLDKKIGALSFLSLSKLLLLSSQGEIFLYDWRSNQLLSTYFSAPNPKYIYALSKDSFAFPAEEKGKVILRREGSEETLLLTVSKREVAALAMNQEGTLLASASSKGTMVKIWNVRGECLYSCRRGNSPASIFSLSLTTKRLALTSDHQTVHVFELQGERGLLSRFSSYLSYSLADYLQSDTSSLQLSSKPSSFVFLWEDKVLLVTEEGEYLEHCLEGGKENVLFFGERRGSS